MTSTAIVTMAKMMETVPEPVQNQIVEHLRDYLAEIQDEIQWDVLFNKTQEQLIAATNKSEGSARQTAFAAPTSSITS